MLPQSFLKLPIDFKGITKVYPPSIKEVLSERDFGRYATLLTKTQEDIWDMMLSEEELDMGKIPENAPSPFEILLLNCKQSPIIKELVIKAFQFFCKEKVVISTDSQMIFFMEGMDEAKDASEVRLLNKDNFFDFQNCLREAIGAKIVEQPVTDENPFVARIKAKFRRREKILKKINSKKGITLTTTLVALCCMNTGLSPLNIGDISYSSVTVLMSALQKKEKYEMDISFLAGGANPKKLKASYWVTGIEE